MSQAHLPRVVRGPRFPFTCYAPSRVHDSYVVTYGLHWPSRSSWIVPGTHPELPGYAVAARQQDADDEVAA